jgi:hypothetical protein
LGADTGVCDACPANSNAIAGISDRSGCKCSFGFYMNTVQQECYPCPADSLPQYDQSNSHWTCQCAAGFFRGGDRVRGI